MITLNLTHQLDLDAINRVVFDGEHVAIGEDAQHAVKLASDFIRERAQSGDAIYGVTTGFGANRDQVIRPEDAEIMQERLLMSHACGVGDPLPPQIVRAMMLLRINALCKGNSGIRLSTLNILLGMLNHDVLPVVPELGSVGASGDLCPLAHMCLPVIGLGEVVVHGERMNALEGFKRVGLEPSRLTYKEGLALLNGTQAMTALGVVVLRQASRLLDSADITAAMSLEAVGGRLAALDARIHEVRGHSGQILSALHVRNLLRGSALAGSKPGSVKGKTDYVQDSYCLRCMPQVHGACRDVITHVKQVIVTEANAVTDNPLIFIPSPEDPEGSILSGGNFHGEPVAMALDYLKIALAELGNISERRSAKLTDKYFSEGLPAFLVSNPGLNSGMMIPQYVAAALVSENKLQAAPASIDSIPTSANMEDHVSMGMHAGLHAWKALTNVERILGIELLIASQALDFREDYVLAAGTSRARDMFRTHVSFMHEDRVLYPDIERAAELVRDGDLVDAVQDILDLTEG